MRHTEQSVYLLTMVLVAVCTTSRASGHRIEKLTIDRREIFDTTGNASSFIGTFINSFHWLTRESTIRQELLYREGDVVDIDVMLESERNLRALGIIGDVETSIDTLSDSTVAVRVTTRDKVTLGVSPSYQQGGGVQSAGFALKDDNFLGKAQSLSLGYRYQSDYDYPHSQDISFSDRRLFGTRLSLKFHYKNSAFLRSIGMISDRPFYADRSPWAGGLSVSHLDVRLPFYEDGLRVRETAFSQEGATAYYARSYGDRLMIRPGVALVHTRSTGATTRTIDNLNLLNVGVNVMRRRYDQRVFLNNHGRTEDVPTGFLAYGMFGTNLHSSSVDGPNDLVQAGWMQSWAIGDDAYFSYQMDFSTFLGNTRYREETLCWSVLHYYKPRYDHTLVVRAGQVIGIDWSPERQLTLGMSDGIRGYRNNAFSGTRRVTYNIEERWLSPAQVWIFKLGAAAFFDGGSAWYSHEPVKFHNAVGIGLRIENTKQQGAGVIRIDLAYNADQRRFAEIIVSSSVFLSAFQDLGFIPPTRIGLP
jgi:hypothetical protein